MHVQANDERGSFYIKFILSGEIDGITLQLTRFFLKILAQYLHGESRSGILTTIARVITTTMPLRGFWRSPCAYAVSFLIIFIVMPINK